MSSVNEVVCLRIFVRGRVQGVGFRWWCRSRALELGLIGFARNLSNGGVEVCAQGGRQECQALVALLHDPAGGQGRPGLVESVVVQDRAVRSDVKGFREL